MLFLLKSPPIIILSLIALIKYPGQGYVYVLFSVLCNALLFLDFIKTDLSKHHFVSLPGIMAFCFYSRSYLSLFVCMFVAGGIASRIEITTNYLGGKNFILCALLTQVVAYRYAHFMLCSRPEPSPV